MDPGKIQTLIINKKALAEGRRRNNTTQINIWHTSMEENHHQITKHTKTAFPTNGNTTKKAAHGENQTRA